MLLQMSLVHYHTAGTFIRVNMFYLLCDIDNTTLSSQTPSPNILYRGCETSTNVHSEMVGPYGLHHSSQLNTTLTTDS